MERANASQLNSVFIQSENQLVDLDWAERNQSQLFRRLVLFGTSLFLIEKLRYSMQLDLPLPIAANRAFHRKMHRFDKNFAAILKFSPGRATSGLVGILVVLAACGGPELTTKIHENNQWIVRLQIIPGANSDKGYSHPAPVAHEKLVLILEALYIESGSFTLAQSFGLDSGYSNRQLVFGKVDAELLAIFIADGLIQASNQEIVTFVNTTETLSHQELVTSGGVYLSGDEVHIVLSNFKVKQAIKQDLDSYRTPARVQPMDSISTQPGRLGFDVVGAAREVPSSESDFKGIWSGVRWHIAVRLNEL